MKFNLTERTEVETVFSDVLGNIGDCESRMSYVMNICQFIFTMMSAAQGIIKDVQGVRYPSQEVTDDADLIAKYGMIQNNFVDQDVALSLIHI